MLSVVICTYNRCESLRDTLRALESQVLDPSIAVEVLVVDNNSTDGTRCVAEAAAAQMRWPVRYILERTQGLTHARNRSLQEAAGELVVFTDDDVVPEPGWLAGLWEGFQRYGADAVGGPIRPLWVVTPPAWLGRAIGHGLFWSVYSLLDHGSEPIVSQPRENGLLYGANMAFRKTVFGDMGLFRTDLGARGTSFRKGEDTEMIDRLLAAGKRVVYTPHAIVRHKVLPERMRRSYIRRWKFAQGLAWVRIPRSVDARAARQLPWTCMVSGWRALRAYVGHHPDLGIQHEAMFWTGLGHMAGTLAHRLRRGV